MLEKNRLRTLHNALNDVKFGLELIPDGKKNLYRIIRWAERNTSR